MGRRWLPIVKGAAVVNAVVWGGLFVLLAGGFLVLGSTKSAGIFRPHRHIADDDDTRLSEELTDPFAPIDTLPSGAAKRSAGGVSAEPAPLTTLPGSKSLVLPKALPVTVNGALPLSEKPAVGPPPPGFDPFGGAPAGDPAKRTEADPFASLPTARPAATPDADPFADPPLSDPRTCP